MTFKFSPVVEHNNKRSHPKFHVKIVTGVYFRFLKCSGSFGPKNKIYNFEVFWPIFATLEAHFLGTPSRIDLIFLIKKYTEMIRSLTFREFQKLFNLPFQFLFRFIKKEINSSNTSSEVRFILIKCEECIQ